MARRIREWSNEHEERLRASGGLGAAARIAGIDEAGRGAWAGPLSVAAVVLPRVLSPWLAANIDDSKRLRPAARAEVAAAVREEARVVVEWGSLEAIEEHNVLGATLRAMARALEGLGDADGALIDGDRLPVGVSVPVLGVVRGDGCVRAIAAASVVAKVARDALMEELDGDYPEYGFARHRGYGTAMHREALRRFGPSRVHRMSYRPVRALSFN
ncbi:MAG: ribonuclease HII [Alphaproteobacteria bacterium]|nr:ribonuclease HII [Alphaproteobacteria bacterium]